MSKLDSFEQVPSVPCMWNKYPKWGYQTRLNNPKLRFSLIGAKKIRFNLDLTVALALRPKKINRRYGVRITVQETTSGQHYINLVPATNVGGGSRKLLWLSKSRVLENLRNPNCSLLCETKSPWNKIKYALTQYNQPWPFDMQGDVLEICQETHQHLFKTLQISGSRNVSKP
jgi:hypothetical protein